MTDKYDVYARVQANMRTLFWGIAIVITVVGVLVAGVIVWLTHDTNGAGGKPGNHSADATIPSGAPRNNPVDIPASQLAEITWAEVKTTGMWLPISPQAGPQNRDHHLASGFTHTPLGAVLAAIHIATRVSSFTGSLVFEPTIENQVIGRDKEKVLAKARYEYQQKIQEAQISAGEPVGNLGITIKGFRIEHIEENYAAIHMLVMSYDREGKIAYIDARYEVQFVEKDWRLVAPLNADWESILMRVSSADSYTLFPPRK